MLDQESASSEGSDADGVSGDLPVPERTPEEWAKRAANAATLAHQEVVQLRKDFLGFQTAVVQALCRGNRHLGLALAGGVVLGGLLLLLLQRLFLK